jgi:hypothetical protein
MKKSDIKALEKIFSAEINGLLPLQSKAKIYLQLEAEGLVAPMERIFGGGSWKIVVKGWQLTHDGRFAYCDNCTTLIDGYGEA